jgi:hypothetical protein
VSCQSIVPFLAGAVEADDGHVLALGFQPRVPAGGPAARGVLRRLRVLPLITARDKMLLAEFD